MNKEQRNVVFDTTREAVRYLDDDMLNKKYDLHKAAILVEEDREVKCGDWIEYNAVCLDAVVFEIREREVYPYKPRKYNRGV